jgi:hypothetical protein
VNRKQRVEELEPQRSTHLARHTGLNVRGVDPNNALRHDHHEADGGQEKRSFSQVYAHAGGDGSGVPHPPRTHHGDREPACNQGHESVAGRVHRRREEEAEEPAGRMQYPAELSGVISEDGAISHRWPRERRASSHEERSSK